MNTDSLSKKLNTLLIARDSAIVLALACLVPILIHLIPLESFLPLGAIWLPIFYAPFIAVMLSRPLAGFIGGVLAPLANMLLTGRPDVYMAKILTVELAIFTILSTLIYKKYRSWVVIAPVSYIVSKFASCIILGMIPYFGETFTKEAFFAKSIFIGLPGIAMLFLINWVMVKYNNGRS